MLAPRSTRIDGQRGGHDEVVERDHEEGDRRDDERPAGTPAGGGCHEVLRVRVVMLVESSACERSHTECDWSLTVWVEDDRGSRHASPSPSAVLVGHQRLGPRLVELVRAHGGDDVEQHAHGEEALDLLVGRAAELLDELDELPCSPGARRRGSRAPGTRRTRAAGRAACRVFCEQLVVARRPSPSSARLGVAGVRRGGARERVDDVRVACARRSATNSSSLVGKSRNRYACEIPAALAMSVVGVP